MYKVHIMDKYSFKINVLSFPIYIIYMVYTTPYIYIVLYTYIYIYYTTDSNINEVSFDSYTPKQPLHTLTSLDINSFVIVREEL